MSSLRRRKIIERLREEGRAAYHAGQHIQTCPHQFMDRFQWEHGFIEAREHAERNHAALCEDYFP